MIIREYFQHALMIANRKTIINKKLIFLGLFSIMIFCKGISQMIQANEIILGNNEINTSIRYCIKDNLGYYWFTTKNGIYRWDAKYSKQYTIKDGLPTN